MSKFALGQLVWTCGVNDEVARNIEFAKFVTDSLKRHAVGDWGTVCAEDKKANDLSLTDGSRLLSAYENNGMPKIWIITESTREVTTVLFPSEY